jgi:hypothetical protein
LCSKLSSELVNKAVDNILAFSAGKDVQISEKTTLKGKKRKFLETVELQIGTFEWAVLPRTHCAAWQRPLLWCCRRVATV